MKRIIILTAVLLLLFSIGANAQDIYDEQYEKSGASQLYNSLPDDVKEFFSELEIDPSDRNFVNKITAGNVFTMLWNFLKSGAKAPAAAAAAVIGIVLILAAFKSFAGEKDTMNTVITYVGTLAAATAAVAPVFGVILSCSRSIKAGATFMLSFVPVFCTVLAASGKPATSAVSGGMLLGASELVVQFASNAVVPIVGAYMAVCICGSVSPLLQSSKTAELMKKLCTWSIGLILTVYMGILGIQTTVNSAADTLLVKTGKFMIGSFVPVVGAPISEALTTVRASVGLLRSTVGIYGVVVLAIILLPTVLELSLWRLSLLLSASAAELFGCGRVASLLRSADAVVSFLMGIMLLNSVAFIMSLAVLTTAGG